MNEQGRQSAAEGLEGAHPARPGLLSLEHCCVPAAGGGQTTVSSSCLRSTSSRNPRSPSGWCQYSGDLAVLSPAMRQPFEQAVQAVDAIPDLVRIREDLSLNEPTL
jgi:hypothetical protein